MHGASRRAWPLIAIAACGTPSRDGIEGAVVSDSAGVRIVESPGVDRPAPWSVARSADLTPPDSALTAHPWGVAADPETGRLYVADRSAERVLVFARSGAYVGALGGSGQGPGEFQRPTALAVGPHGALTVWDTGRGVLSRWSSRGDLLNEVRAPVAYWGPGIHDRPGHLLTVTSRTTGSEQWQDLVDVTVSDTTVLHSVARELVPIELPCIRQRGPRLFAPSVVWGARDDEVHVLRGSEYRIDRYAGDRLIASARRGLGPVRVSHEMAVERVRLEYAGFMRTCGVTAEAIVEAVGHEEAIPAVQWIAVDPVGRLWVSRLTDGLLPDRIDILDDDGAYLGTVPGPMAVAFLSDTRFAGLTVHETTGETVLSLYDLEGVGPADGAAGGPGSDRWTPVPHAGLREFRDCPDCPVMVELPPGRFRMGAPPGEEPAVSNPDRPEWTELAERPQVDVEIGYRLAVGKYEVTFADWDRCVADGGCDYEPEDEGWGRGDRPVIHIARADALRYAAWLAGVTGQPYRLPSEAEWEYAARAGTVTARYWGDDIAPGLVACDGCGTEWDRRSTTPVGHFPPNQFGLHDMLGNVSEWVADCWHENHEGQPGDGSPRVETSPWWRDGECERPVHRGGTYASFTWANRAAYRNYYWPGPWTDRDSDTAGFRLARTIATPARDGSESAAPTADN